MAATITSDDLGAHWRPIHQGLPAESIHVDLRRLKLVEGDQLVLCTDGLTEVVTDEQIADILGGSRTSAEACRTMIDRALEGGGPDNITVVAARWKMSQQPA